MTASFEEFLACLFILLADNSRYKGLKIDLANYFTMGNSNYPKTLVASKRFLTDYIVIDKSNCAKQEPDDAGVVFSKRDHDNDWKKNVTCHGCVLKEHQLKEYNKIKPVGRHDMESTALVIRKGSKRILCWWKCYLDSCA